MTFIMSFGAGTAVLFNNGQSYKIYQCYPQLDQLGRGSGDLIADTVPGNGNPINTVTGQATWPHQVSEPVYQWGNTFNGVHDAAIGPNSQGYAVIQLNRDYYDNTPKPGYTPLPFPHPLVSTNSVPVSTGGGSGTSTVVPPGNLQARPPQ